MQLQGHVQVLLNMLTFGYHPQAALDSHRICIDAETHAGGKTVVYVEEGISEETVEGLKKLGHQVKVLSAWKRGMFGCGQIIRAHYDKGQLVWSSGSGREETACPFRLLTVRLRRLSQRDAIRYSSQASTSCLSISKRGEKHRQMI